MRVGDEIIRRFNRLARDRNATRHPFLLIAR